MSEETPFLDLIQRVRAGDQDAVTALVREYEPAIRRTLKVQLRDHRLRRQVDSLDICQSVLANFFVRAALGQFELDNPKDLLALLATMARNKLATKARQAEVVRRDYRGLPEDSAASDQLLASGASPSQKAAGQELLEMVRQRLSREERWLAEQRAEGRAWAEIAADRGGSAEALRKQLERALDRVADELGLEETDT